MKTCTRCNQEKDETEFYPRKNRKSGRNSRCSACECEIHSDYYQSHKEQLLERAKEYAAKHKAERKEYVKRHYQEHKEQIFAYHKRYRSANPTKAMDRSRQRRFNVSPEDYAEQIRIQGGACALCGNIPKTKRPLGVDHCHTTGKVRKLLCVHCNSLLGFARDNPEILKKAIIYLQENA